MTLQQEAVSMINNLPDDSVKFVIEMMRRMIAPVAVKSKAVADSTDILKRFGAGVGTMNDPAGFDDMDQDVLDYFEEVGVI